MKLFAQTTNSRNTTHFTVSRKVQDHLPIQKPLDIQSCHRSTTASVRFHRWVTVLAIQS